MPEREIVGEASGQQLPPVVQQTKEVRKDEELKNVDSVFRLQLNNFIKGESFQLGHEHSYPKFGEVSESIQMALHASVELLRDSAKVENSQLVGEANEAVADQLSKMGQYVYRLIGELRKRDPELSDRSSNLPMFHEFYKKRP